MLKQQLSQKLQQKLSPQQIQLMKLLQLPQRRAVHALVEQVALAVGVQGSFARRNEEQDYAATGSGGMEARAFLKGAFRDDLDRADALAISVEADRRAEAPLRVRAGRRGGAHARIDAGSLAADGVARAVL